jgi:adenine/guanine phosphoribosyltransferase-like PRPP-binding protein
MTRHDASPHYTEPTTPYWQSIERDLSPDRLAPPWRYGYPAVLPDGGHLILPIRRLANEPSNAVASLILNQASLTVVQALGEMLARQLAPLRCDLLVGLPTLGLALAPIVAKSLGHDRYVPLGYSRKFWYDEALSTAVHSITSPGPGKRLYLDPNQRTLLKAKRLVIVDDAVSSGTTLLAAWNLVQSLGGHVVGCGVAMRQGARWAHLLGTDRARHVIGVFESPLLEAVPQGWDLRR